MVLPQMVVDSVVLEGRSIRVTAQRYGVSKSWVAELVKRYRAGGAEALVPKSKRPKSNPRSMSPVMEERIVTMRKELEDSVPTPAPRRSTGTSPKPGSPRRRSRRSIEY